MFDSYDEKIITSFFSFLTLFQGFKRNSNLCWTLKEKKRKSIQDQIFSQCVCILFLLGVNEKTFYFPPHRCSILVYFFFLVNVIRCHFICGVFILAKHYIFFLLIDSFINFYLFIYLDVNAPVLKASVDRRTAFLLSRKRLCP